MIVFFASLMRPNIGNDCLTEMAIPHRLLSFYELKDYTDDSLAYFVKHGDARQYKSRRKWPSVWENTPYLRTRRLELSRRARGAGDDYESDPVKPLIVSNGHGRVVDLMLDSGAFAAWKHGAVIDIDEYITFIKDNNELLYSYVNLDVIPSKYGQPRSLLQVNQAAQQSYDNYTYMKQQGLSPLPVFHRGEPFEWLLKLAEEDEYIGVSPRSSDRQSINWLDKVFTLLTDRRGRIKTKVHGFGIVAPAVMLRYPWFSLDSTTWNKWASVGFICVPKRVGPGFRYDLTPLPLYVSDRFLTSRKTLAYGSLGPQLQDYINEFLGGAGLDIVDVRYSYVARVKAMTYFMQNLIKIAGDKPFKYRVQVNWQEIKLEV